MGASDIEGVGEGAGEGRICERRANLGEEGGEGEIRHKKDAMQQMRLVRDEIIKKSTRKAHTEDGR